VVVQRDAVASCVELELEERVIVRDERLVGWLEGYGTIPII
jgi:hypothetical protein